MIYEHFKAYALEKRLQRMQRGFGHGTLSAELGIAHTLRSLPKATIPTPHKRRAYLQQTITPEVVHGLHLAHIASRIAGATLVLGLLTTSLLAWASKPGSLLYAYKNQTHELRLMFVASESKQAALRLSYVENRIEETRTVLESDADSKTKATALSELSKQTQATVEAVKQVALNQKDPALLDRLQTISDKQTEVLAQTTDPDVKPAAAEALKTTEAGSKSIAVAKRLVTASIGDAALTKLSDSTTLKGTVSKVGTESITLEKDQIKITKDTVITFDAALSIPQTQKATLQAGQRISVTATQTGDKEKTYTATEIVITALAGKVKGTTTTPEEPLPTTPAEIEKSIPETPEVDTAPSKVQTNFLIENPAPLYDK